MILQDNKLETILLPIMSLHMAFDKTISRDHVGRYETMYQACHAKNIAILIGASSDKTYELKDVLADVIRNLNNFTFLAQAYERIRTRVINGSPIMEADKMNSNNGEAIFTELLYIEVYMLWSSTTKDIAKVHKQIVVRQLDYLRDVVGANGGYAPKDVLMNIGMLQVASWTIDKEFPNPPPMPPELFNK